MKKLLLWIASLAAAGATTVALTSHLSPLRWKWLGFLPLGFPVAVGVAVSTLLLVLLFRPKKAWLPLLLALPAYWKLPTYAPFHPFAKSQQGDLKVMTYNVLFFQMHNWGENNRPPIAQYIASQKPDLVFLQEAYMAQQYWDLAVMPTVKPYLQYYKMITIGPNAIAMLSKYPIVGAGRIKMPGDTNGAAYFQIVKAPGDTLLAVNCHLEAIRISYAEREEYSELAGNASKKWSWHNNTPVQIAKKIALASQVRAQQAQALRLFLLRHAGKKIILAGDFNDTPISYAHRQINKELTDCYAAAGTGIGRSFNQYRMFVRIDHLFCSPHFTPTHASLHKTEGLSDHYPLVVTLKENE